MTDSRKYFGTDGIRGTVGNGAINPEFMVKLGWAIGKVLGERAGNEVLIGKDTRRSGYMLEAALESGLSAAGVNIGLLGPMPTPGIAYLTRHSNAKAGIVISASHNPHYDNGIKIFSSKGYKILDEVEQVIEATCHQTIEMVAADQLGSARRVDDAVEQYSNFCRQSIPANVNLSGLKIILDCANGAAYHIAPDLLEQLGAEVICLGVSPNGLNINDGCGSTKPQAMQQAVLEHKADVGIAFDGDADRIIMVDNQGECVDGDEILFILAKYKSQQGKVEGVVGTVMSNLGLEKALQHLGIPFMRSKVGDRHVMDCLKQQNWQLGGEASGHVMDLSVTTTGDGIIAALQVLAAMFNMQQPLHELKAGMSKFPQALHNIALPAGSDVMTNKAISQAVQHAEQQLADKGRVLLRPSGTEPLVRVMVEGEDQAQVEQVAVELADKVKSALK